MCQPFCQNVYFFGEALTTVALSCCDGKTTENMKHKVCLLVERDGQKKPKRAGSRSREDRLPPGSLHPCSPLRMSYFSMFPFVSLRSYVPVRQQKDRLYESLIVSSSSLVLSSEGLLQLWDKNLHILLPKQTKKNCLWTDFFVLLLFCKCTIKYIWCWFKLLLVSLAQHTRPVLIHVCFFQDLLSSSVWHGCYCNITSRTSAGVSDVAFHLGYHNSSSCPHLLSGELLTMQMMEDEVCSPRSVFKLF